jgi:lipopolysaccharide export system permease protein
LILHRAFSREVLQNTGAVAVLVLAIFLVIRVVGYFRLVAEGIIPTNSVLTLLVLRLLSHLDIIAPLAVYVAMLLVLGRWSRDRETVVAAAAGLGMASFLRPAFYLLIILGIVIGGFSLYLSPLALRSGDHVEHEFRSRSETSGIVPGVFTENLGGDGVYFVESYDPDEDLYRNIFGWALSEGSEGVVIASTAKKTAAEAGKGKYLLLHEGVRYDGRPGESGYQSIEFETYSLLIDGRPIPQSRTRLAGLGTSTLWDRIRKLRRLPATISQERAILEYRSELHWRLSKIAILPILMVLALALGYGGQSQNRVLMMVGALMTYFAYANLGGYLVALSRRGHAEPLTLLWFLHLLVALIAFYLFRRRAQNRALFVNSHKASG